MAAQYPTVDSCLGLQRFGDVAPITIHRRGWAMRRATWGAHGIQAILRVAYRRGVLFKFGHATVAKQGVGGNGLVLATRGLFEVLLARRLARRSRHALID